MICGSCGSEVPGSPKFCNKCGAAFTAAGAAPPAAPPGATKICPQCGAVNAATAKFCKKDGYDFDKAPAVAAPAAPRPQVVPPPRPAAPPAPPRPQQTAPTATSQPAIPGSIACPTCGTLNPPNARFCKKDGTALGAAAAAPAAARPPVAPAAPPPRPTPRGIELSLADDPEPQPAPPPMAPAPPPPPPRPAPMATQPVEAKAKIEIPRPAPAPTPDETGVYPTGVHKRPRSKAAMFTVIGTVVVLAAAAVGYMYWKGILGNRAETVTESVLQSAREKGFDGLTLTIAPDWTATVSGTVVGDVRRDELLGIIQKNPNIKSVTDNLTVRPGPGDLEQQVGDALSSRGLKDVTVTVGDDLVAMLKGTVDDPALETVAVDTARAVNGLKDVQSAIKLSIAARQAALTAALASGGFAEAQAQIADENTVNIIGNVYSAEEKTKLIELVTATTGIATLNDTTQIIERPPVVNPGKVEADINKALKSAGLPDIAAVVDEQLNATLVGSVTRASDRDKAMRTARKITAIKSLRSEIEVASAAPAAAAPVPIGAGGAIIQAKGQWGGKISAGFLSTFPFVIIINGGPLGQDVGTSIYGSGQGVCAGTLTLTEASGTNFTFTENITRNGFNCPGGGTLKMQMTPDGKAKYEWYRPKNPSKRYATGVGVRK
jgi:osmotically-inducible protein OsmY/ribosomal protein L40E